MMPDKLYVWTGVLGSLYASSRKPEEVNSEEYIRKDALLEWAKARKAGLSSGESFVAGERKMLKEIIEKIESL